MRATANRFRAGHRLRVDISSADFPRFVRWIARRPETYRLVGSVDDVEHCKQSGNLGITFDVEGMYPVEDDLSLVQTFYRMVMTADRRVITRHVKLLELRMTASYYDGITLNKLRRMATLSEVRDAFQQRLLTFLYRGPASSSLVLKGGAAMRVLTASARYTQDLDFDHDPRRSLASLQTTVRSAIAKALQGSGLAQTSISEPKQTDTVARWKISGRTSAGEDLHLTVEVSRRGIHDLDHVVKIPVQIGDRTLPRVYVSVYDERALADNKLAALLDERRTAPRDIYDLEVLLARGACPSGTVVERVGGRAALLRRAGEKLDLMGWPLFRDQVLPALPQEIQTHVDEHEYLAMKVRLLESLERCLASESRTETRP